MARDGENQQQANGSGGDLFAGKRVPIAALKSPAVRAEVTAVRDLASSLLSSQGLLDRSQFGLDAHRAGYSYFNRTTGRHARDPYRELGYPSTSLSVADHRARFKFGGIARRLVNALPKAAWGRGVSVQDDPDPKNTTPFEGAVAGLLKRLDAIAKLRRAHVLAALGQYSAVLVGAEGDLERELESVTAEGLLYLSVFAEDRAEITKIVEDWADPRFGLPEEYELDFGAPAMARKGGGRRASRGKRLVRKAHWSRVVHVVLDPLEDDVFGDPVLQAVWCYLDDLIKLVGGGAEAAWKRMDPGTILKLPFLPDSETEGGQEVEYDEEEEEAVLAQFKLLRHGLERVIALRGVETETLDVSQVVFAASADKVLDLIAGTSEMPKRILLGSERGEQASTQDRSNWADRIQEYCEGPCETTLRALVDRWVDLGAVPEPADGEYEVVWAEIDELNSGEQAEMASTLAAANADQQQSEGRVIFTADEIRDRIFGLEPLEEVQEGEGGGVEEAGEDFAEEEEAGLRAAADLADREAEEPEWRAVHRAADSRRLKLIAVILALWTSAAAQHLEAETLERFLENDSRVGAGRVVEAALMRAEAEFAELLTEELSATLNAGAEAALRSARGRGSWFRAAVAEDVRAAQFEGVFDATNPRALKWAADRSSALVKEIGAETRLALRDLIAAGFRDGLPPRVLAQRIRESVGLLSRQVGAVERLRAQLYGARPGELITRFPPRPGVRSVAGFRARVPAGGFTNAQVDRLAAKYSRMHLNLRARTIARTETLRAANSGQAELWKQARDEGHLPRDQRRVWIATPDDRVRPEHADRDGYVVGLEEEWPWGTEPGEEVSCRCSQGLTDEERTIAQRPTTSETELLRSARVTAVEPIPGSASTVRKLSLEGERQAYWKAEMPNAQEMASPIRAAGGTQADREVLAHQIDTLFGTRLTPPTAYRTLEIEGSQRAGSISSAIDGRPAAMAQSALLRSDGARRVDMALFDIAIGNADRHAGNILVGLQDELAAIDQGVSFLAANFGKISSRTGTHNFWWYDAGISQVPLSGTQQAAWLSRLRDPELFRLIESSPLGPAAKAAAKSRIEALTDLLQDGNLRGIFR